VWEKIGKLWPSQCILCDNQGLEDKDICQFCFNDLLKNQRSCFQCATPLPAIDNHQLCGNCQSTSPDFDLSYAPFIYQGAMRYLISQLKFHQRYKNARLLGHIFAESLSTPHLPQCIIPVPLHKKRYRQRGFNQSLEIAKTVAKKLAIPIETKLCKRHKNTVHQIGLSLKERHHNVNNAFAMIQTTNYNHIALLDDVMTTGSTLQALATVFKQAGVETIELWVCARASINQ
jgi:ComF family protein